MLSASAIRLSIKAQEQQCCVYTKKCINSNLIFKYIKICTKHRALYDFNIVLPFFCPLGVPLYTFGAKKRASCTFLESLTACRKLLFRQAERTRKCPFLVRLLKFYLLFLFVHIKIKKKRGEIYEEK